MSPHAWKFKYFMLVPIDGTEVKFGQNDISSHWSDDGNAATHEFNGVLNEIDIDTSVEGKVVGVVEMKLLFARRVVILYGNGLGRATMLFCEQLI